MPYICSIALSKTIPSVTLHPGPCLFLHDPCAADSRCRAIPDGRVFSESSIVRCGQEMRTTASPYDTVLPILSDQELGLSSSFSFSCKHCEHCERRQPSNGRAMQHSCWKERARPRRGLEVHVLLDLDGPKHDERA
jgi:hypothetical protein